MSEEQEKYQVAKREPINIDITAGIAPHNYQELLQFAALYKDSGLAPKSFQTAQQLAIAIGMCMELSRPILTGVQDMAVINGRVGVFGDATMAIIRSSGLLEVFEQWEEGKPYTDEWTVHTKVRRKGMKEKTDYWSWADSKKAGFDNPQTKDGRKDIWSPWTRFTRRMMYFKSRNFLLRDEFGDILKGMNTVEELQEVIDVTPQKTPIVTTEPKPGKDIYAIKDASESPQDSQDASQSTNGGKQGESTGEPEPPAESLFESLKKMRPSTSAQNMEAWKHLIAEKAVEIRTFTPDAYEYITKKWLKACPGEPFPARPLTDLDEPPPDEDPVTEIVDNGKEIITEKERRLKAICGYRDELGLPAFNQILMTPPFNVKSLEDLPEMQLEDLESACSRKLDEAAG